MHSASFIYNRRIVFQTIEKIEDFQKYEVTKAASTGESVCPMNDSALNLIFIAPRLTCFATAGTDLFVRYDIVNGLCAIHKSAIDRTRGKSV